MHDLHSRRARARSVRTLVVAVLMLLAAGAWGAGALSRLQSGGFDDPGAESARAADVLATELGVRGANLVVLVTASSGGSVDDPASSAAGAGVRERLRAQPGVAVLADYWSATGAPREGLVGRDRRSALVLAHLGGDEDDVREVVSILGPDLAAAAPDGVRIELGGHAQVTADLTAQVRRDLATAEAIAVPATVVLLALTLGSVLAGLLPMLVGVCAMVGTLAVLRTLTLVTDVSVFSLNLTIALGLGLGLDYGLLIVNRFAEELDHGRAVDDAVAVAMGTAGRTVIYSAATVAAALGALLGFPVYFLRSFAYAGIPVVALTALAALTVLPSALRLLGRRASRRRGRGARSERLWGRVAGVVLRRPVLAAAPVLAGLALLALPMGGVSFGLPDDRAIGPEHSQARRVADVLRSDYPTRESEAVVVAFPAGAGDSPGDLAAYASSVSRLAQVARVDAPDGTFVEAAVVGPGQADLRRGGAAAVRVVPREPAYAESTQALVEQIRAMPTGRAALVGGPTARFLDVNAAIASRLPLVGLLIAATSVLVVFLFTGSLWLPIKALAVNAVTICAVLGAMVWVFQDGHGADLLGVTPLPLSVSIPPLMFCLAFGLSMDYEVFLLGRIKEHHDAGLDNVAAVAAGLARTGRIVTAAAGLMAVTFLAFVTSRVGFIQMLGLGCALAVLLDATVVRGVLVPALMRLAGRWNWWAPAPLVRLHARIAARQGPS
ncbi:MAG: MMPL family transporter [Dermatophilaceae bacterium]